MQEIVKKPVAIVDYNKTPVNPSTNPKTELARVIGDAAKIWNAVVPKEETYFRCTTCEEVFSSKASCMLHHLKSHGAPKPFKCPHCEKRFDFKSRMQDHVRWHTGERPYECQYCKKRFICLAAMKNHAKIHQPKAAFQCSVCPRTFRKGFYLKEHERLHMSRGERLQCDVCHDVFKSQFERRVHMKRHAMKSIYCCPSCEKVFTSRQALKLHRKAHHATEETPKHDEGKRNGVEQEKGSKREEKIGQGEALEQVEYDDLIGEYEEVDIQKKSVSISSLLGTTGRTHGCEFCACRFNSKLQLREHVNLHLGDAPYMCALCNERFPTIESLARHESQHSEGSDNRCVYCDEEVTQNIDV